MDQVNFEQIVINKSLLGEKNKLLKEGLTYDDVLVVPLIHIYIYIDIYLNLKCCRKKSKYN